MRNPQVAKQMIEGVPVQAARPWWREPWPWLLMSGPLVAIVGCGVTIWLAGQNPDRPIASGVARHGLVVESVPAAGASGQVRGAPGAAAR